jgi:hypothetical protein
MNFIGDYVSLLNLTPPEVVYSVVPDVRGNRKHGLKALVKNLRPDQQKFNSIALVAVVT